jgi:hypothetical protein
MDNQLTLGRVHVVEWLNAGDDDTGQKLFAELQPMGAASQPKVEVEFYRIDTTRELLGLLSAFTDQYRADKLTPLLHLETHGNENGIGTDAEGIEWRDLAEALVPLNHATRMKLVINLAACSGAFGTTMLRPDFGPAPFRGLIGPRRELDETEVLAGCRAFYGTIFDQKDGNSALKAMNDAVTTAEETFWTMSAELAFKVAFQDYMLRGEGSPQGAAVRAEAFATRRAAKVSAQRGAPVPDAEVAEWRERTRAFLLNHEARFDLEWRKFFYIDEFPENAKRFDFTLEDCTAADNA